MKHTPLLLSLTLLAPSVFAASGDGPESIAESSSEKIGPRAVVDQPVYDFGVLAPQEVAEHRFKLRNDGDEYLTIEKVVASCKCVLPESVAEGVPPGGTVEVPVSFKGKPTQERYAQSVTLKTNDPTRPHLLLRIVGRITPDVVLLPGELLFPGIEPDQPVSGRVDVLTAVWNDFDLEVVKTSNPAVTAVAQRLSRSSLDARDASAGWSVSVDVEGSIVQDTFKEQVYLTATPTNPEGEPRALRFNIVGKTLGRIMVQGKGLDELGRMKLGAIDPRIGKKTRYIAKVRDPEPNLKVKEISVVPDYVNVTLEPFRQVASNRIYRLEVSVPPGKLDKGYIGPNAGSIRLEFDHPRIKDLELKLEMLPAAPR